MKIKDQVCTQDQAKRLEQFGIRQWSSFYWWYHFKDKGMVYSLGIDDESDRVNKKWCAFTVAELGIMLPEYIHDDEWFLEMYKDRSNAQGEEWFLVRYVSDGETHFGFNMKSESECRACMLIYLLENKLVTAEECNKRIAA